MTASPSQKEPTGAATRRFELSVWQQTGTGDWRAEIRNGVEEPLRFERPLDLLIYLTALSPVAPAGRRGLR